MRKTIVTFLLALIPMTGFAWMGLPEDATGLSSIGGRIQDWQFQCVSVGFEPCVEFADIKLEFALFGCADDLLPLVYQIDESKNEQIITVHAQNVHTKMSEKIRCIRAPSVTRSIRVPVKSFNIQIRFLGADVSPLYIYTGPVFNAQ